MSACLPVSCCPGADAQPLPPCARCGPAPMASSLMFTPSVPNPELTAPLTQWQYHLVYLSIFFHCMSYILTPLHLAAALLWPAPTLTLAAPWWPAVSFTSDRKGHIYVTDSIETETLALCPPVGCEATRMLCPCYVVSRLCRVQALLCRGYAVSRLCCVPALLSRLCCVPTMVCVEVML